jgi:His-Xaa-Ser system protein HxsD
MPRILRTFQVARAASKAVTAGAVGRQVEFDLAAVSVDAVQRAAYRLSDRISIDLKVDGKKILCRLYSSRAHEGDDLAGEFRKEVLDQVLRERIRVETEPARNLILALAFSRTGAVPES